MKSEQLNAKNWNLLKLQRYQQNNHEAKVRLGTPTWESVKFCGTLYDYKTPTNEFLKNYSSQYDAVEYHYSFTDLPSERRIKALKAEVAIVNPDFKFCPVIPRRISHEFPLGENVFDLKEFITNVKFLENHLGPCILRLPETFSPSMMRNLTRFLETWDPGLRLAIHLTHADWFRRGDSLTFLAKELDKSSISILVEDKIESNVVPEKLLTSDHLVVRFYGRPGLNQDEQRLAMWVYKLGEFKGYGIKNPFFFLHEQEEMCLSILRKVAHSLGGNTRVPSTFDVNSNQISFLF